MNEQIIKLVFPKDLAKLAGNRFGRTTYETQVKGKINFNSQVVFVFPEGIDRIASSFVQGFFDEIMMNLGLSGIKEKIFFESSIEGLKDFILENLG